MADLQKSSDTYSTTGTAVLRSSRLRRAFTIAFGGLAWAWRSQPNFRIEVSIGTLAIALGAWLSVNLVPILLCCSIVLSLELINTAIEATVDLASPELHQLAKRAKDFAAAAVLVAVLFSTLVGLIALGPPLIARIASSL